MKKLLFISTLFLLFSCENSTEYHGTILDNNEKGIAAVKIQIIGTDIYTFSDDAGTFSISHENRGKELLVLKDGYKMVFYTPKNEDEEILIELEVE